MVQLVEAEVGPQQCELDKIELGAAAADPFEFIGNWFQRVDRGVKISSFETSEGA